MRDKNILSDGWFLVLPTFSFSACYSSGGFAGESPASLIFILECSLFSGKVLTFSVSAILPFCWLESRKVKVRSPDILLLGRPPESCKILTAVILPFCSCALVRNQETKYEYKFIKYKLFNYKYKLTEYKIQNHCRDLALLLFWKPIVATSLQLYHLLLCESALSICSSLLTWSL